MTGSTSGFSKTFKKRKFHMLSDQFEYVELNEYILNIRSRPEVLPVCQKLGSKVRIKRWTRHICNWKEAYTFNLKMKVSEKKESKDKVVYMGRLNSVKSNIFWDVIFFVWPFTLGYRLLRIQWCYNFETIPWEFIDMLRYSS